MTMPRPVGYYHAQLSIARDDLDDLAEQMHLDGVYAPILLDAEDKVRQAWALLAEVTTALRASVRVSVMDGIRGACSDCGGSERVQSYDGSYVVCPCHRP